MSNRKSSFRFVSTIIAIIAISAVTYASPWSQALSYLGITSTGPEDVSETVTANAVMTAGTCGEFGGLAIEVEATGGTNLSYATLKEAFDAINAGNHTGTITIDVCGDTTEPTIVAAPSVQLNASGVGSASYTSITMSPAGGAARTISGAATAGFALIDLVGADNLTIDGLNSGGNSLTIANTTVSATSITSTFRFIGGATGNTITNSNIQGSGTMSVATNGAVIFFSTDAVTANGNDNNTISNNNIGPAGANLPTKGILCNGSTTTTAIGNSGIVINNNNIFDYFGAAVTSAGVAVNGGCNALSITNNRFYQTAPRTWTTGALHNGILLNSTTTTSGVQGMTVTGNIIGYASNTQTGTYALSGSTGSFRGIVLNGITAGTVSNINNNTIASVSVTGVTSSGTSSSAPFMGIYVTNGNAITNGNTIGSQSANGSLTYSTTSASAADAIGMFNFSVDPWTANNNSVGGITASNAGAGAANAYGIRLNTGSTVATGLSGNNVGGTVANSIQSTSTATGSQVAGIFVSTSIATVSNNTVRNLTAAGGTGTTTAASVVGIAFVSSTPINTVSQNTIFNLTNTNTTAASTVTGIQFTGGTGNVVERNFIYGLTSATTSSTAEINGIRVAGGTTTYRNNMIALGANQAVALGSAASNSGTSGINGFNGFLGTDAFVHNSVYIGGTATSGSGASYALNGTQTVNTRSFRDNIFYNARTNSGATGSNYAVKINGTTANPTGLTINNNLYFVNGTGGVFGYFNSADVANLAAWKTAVGQDLGSFESNPQFNDATNAIPDLHLHPTTATVAEGNGAEVGVTNDFDGQTRASFTPVDIGADAGNFNGIDLAPPVISYTALANTNLTTDRVLSVTLTDVSGVATGGDAPRVYFNKNAGTYSSTACSLAGGTVQNGTWNCTIDNSLIGGVVTADVIRYFVVAQDISGNLGSNPSAGFSGTNVNTVTTPPTTPNSYLIAQAISGTRTVCATGCDYTTLTGATGIFKAINDGVATGNINIEIAGDLTTGEDGTNGLNALAEQPSGSNFTVKIYPTGSARAITGAANTALIRTIGASRVTIDGSIGGTGTDRSLTITNTSATTPSVILFGSTGTTPISNNTLKNCVVINGVNTSSAVVISDGTTLGTAGYFSNITIQNNDVQKAFVGVFATGGTTPQGGSNLVYTQNKVDTSGANAVRNVGLYMQGVNGATVSNNTVGNFSNVEGENDTGIWLASGTINATVSGNNVSGLGMTLTTGFAPFGIRESSGSTASGNTISNNTITNLTTTGSTGLRGIAASSTGVTIERNNISNVQNNNTGTFGAFGIDITAGNDDVIKNNFISDVNHNMTGGAAFTPDFGVVGIRLGAGTGHKVYNNSVNLFGTHPGTATTSLLSAAFSISTTAQTGIDVRNNIFANNITGGTTSIAHVSVYLPSGGTSAMNLTWNNNSYYFGTDATKQGTGQAGTTAGTNFFTTLPLLAAYTSGLSPAATNDNASIASSGAVPFSSATDLHISVGAPEVNAAVAVAGVNNDFDGDGRPGNLGIEIGADEIADANAPDTTILTNPTNPSNTNSATFTFSGTDTLVSSTEPKGDGTGSRSETDAPSALAGFECRLDAGAWVSCTSGIIYNSLTQGSHTFDVRAKDANNNVDPSPASYTWFVDTVAPTTSLDSFPTNPSTSNSATFTFSAVDPAPASGVAGFECKLDAGAYAVCTSPANVTGLSQGSHTFNVRSTDAAGNVSVDALYTWTVDAIAPDTTILTNPTDPSNSANATFTFSGTDSLGAPAITFECQIDGGAFGACTSPKNYTGLADGSHTFQVRAKDTVGNVDPTPASYTWAVDTVAPTASLDSLPPNPSNSSSANFAFSAIDPAPASGVTGFECQLDAGAFAACTSPVNLTGLSQGSHTFTVKATDAAGNTSVPTFFTWSVDAIAPDTQILTNPPDPSTSSSATFTFSGTDSAMSAIITFECKLDGGAFGACTSPKSYAGLSNGSHTFEVRSVDSVGNIDLTPATYTWTINVGPTPTPTPQTTVYQNEIEPNGTAATATVVTTPSRIKGYVYQNGDIDYYAFPATAGDKVYSAVMTSASANGSTDSQLRLYASDGTTEIEFDEDDGSLGGLSSTIAGATIPSTGTYYLRVNHFSATNQLRPYELYIKLQSGAPVPETEINDTPITANTVPAGGWVSGVRSPAVATEQDWYSMTLNAGDTVYLGMDLDPERDNVQWNGRLGLALFGDAGNQILVVDDGSTGSAANPLSEAFFFTVKTSGTYYAFVDSASAATGGPTATYNLSVTVFPKIEEGVSCTTYTSTNVPQTIGPSAGLVSSTITIPGNPRVADLDISIDMTHALMADVDAHLRSPAGNDVGLFTDIGAAATGGQTQMDLIFDDEAGLTPAFTALKGVQVKPELAYSLSWFDGENAGGTWTLDLRDDTTNASGGTLNGWSIKVCEQPAAPSESVVFGTDFESGAAGFTSSGTANEWEIGLPATVATTTSNPIAAFNSCNSGVNCWKTDLDNTYDVSSSQDLLSPNINLTGVSAPITLKWAQQFQMENASFDHARVIVQQVGNPASARTVWEWTGPTMTDSVGNPAVNIGTTAGWGNYRADISSFAGQNIEVIFHVDSDTTINFGGLAIDDVAVVTADTTAPDTQILTNPTNPSTSADATFTFTGTDSAIATVASFECQIDGGGFSACTSPQSYMGLSQGSHTFQVRAKDGAGNVDPTPASFTWTIDAIAPDTTILTNPTDPSNSSNATFTFSGTDSLGAPAITFECQIDGGGFSACTSPKTYTGLADGSHTFQVRAKDAVGNVDPTPASYTWTINTVPASPVTVTATAGTTGPTGYNTVKEAFDAINAGTHQGAVTVSVNANTTETASAVLNASGGTSAYTSVLVRPTAVVSVSGSIVGAVIKLNGADNVTIDGRIGGTGSSRDLTVANTSNTTATAAIWLSSLGAGAGASGNTIRNVELAGGAPQNTGTLSTYGIIMSGTAISTTSNGEDNDNNSFIANRIIRVRYGILTRGLTTNLNANPVVTDNIIGPAAFGADAVGKVGIFMQADSGATVSRNTIQFIGGDFANTSGGADRVGIAIGSDAWGSTPSTLLGTGYTVARNVIHDVIEERTFSAVGIYLGAVNGTSPTGNVVANNFVYNLKANGTLGDAGVGIGIAGGNGDSVVFNSVRMEGDMDPNAGATAPTQTSVNMRIANTPTNLTVKNNSLYNDVFSSSTPALNTVNIQVQSATFAFGTGGLNNNNYYFPATNTVARTGAIGTASLATTFFATLANWQAAITPAQDAASIQADPQYVSASDLHIALGSPNVNAGAAGTGVVNDIDGQLRDATPDIGADEPNGVTPPANDIAASAINSPVTGSTLPNGSTVTPQAKFTNVGSATQTNVGVQFTITGPGGYSYTDNQVIASIGPDSSATVTFAAAPAFTTAGGYTTTALVTTSDTNPGNDSTGGSFNVLDPLNGPYTVGTGGAFTSLTNPGGLFDALNTLGAAGNVTANITTDLTAETGAIQLNQLPGGFGLTIKPSGAPRTISGNGASLGLIKLFGADNVTIDGSLSGGSDRSLTITYGNTGGAVIWIQAASASNGALGTTIKNTNLSGNTGTTIIAGIISGSGVTLGGAAESPNSNTTIQNNWMYRVQNAIYNQGAVAFDQNWNITGNTFGSTVAADKNSFRGMLIGNVQNFVVNGNTIAGISSTPTTTAAMSGIQLAFAINGGSIVNNVIRDIRNNSASGTGAYGINVTSTSAAANVTIANNSVSDVAALGSATVLSNGFGINFNATGAAGYKLYHNSVNMNTNQSSGTTAAMHVAAGVTAAGALDVQNNIFANTQTSGATRYAVYSAAAASVYTPINYNDYFAANVGFIGGSARVTLGDWQTATTQDANSLAVDPLFVGPTNLHISAGSPMIDTAVTIPAVNSDFDGQTRPIGAANDIGADEWVATITISGRVLTSDGQGIKNVLVSLTDSGAGPKRSTLTGPFGYYSFTGQPSNLVYTVSVGSKRFTFTPNFRDVGGYADITNFDFTADPLP